MNQNEHFLAIQVMMIKGDIIHKLVTPNYKLGIILNRIRVSVYPKTLLNETK